MPQVDLSHYIPYDYESITVTNSAVGLDTSKLTQYPAHKLRVLITCENGDVRWRVDGNSDPTSAEGHILEKGMNLTIDGMNTLTRFKAIKSGTDDGILRVTYFRS
jgi:hypothetical protein